MWKDKNPRWQNVAANNSMCGAGIKEKPSEIHSMDFMMFDSIQAN